MIFVGLCDCAIEIILYLCEKYFTNMSENKSKSGSDSVNDNEFFGIDITRFLPGNNTKEEDSSPVDIHPSNPKKKKKVSSKAIIRPDIVSESSRVRTYLAFPSSFAFKLKVVCSMNNLKPSDFIVDCCSDKIDVLFNNLMSSYEK